MTILGCGPDRCEHLVQGRCSWCAAEAREGHDAQPTPAPTALEVSLLRSLSPARLAAHVLATQAGLGGRFDFPALGVLLARATDEELLALHRPTRGTR